MTIILALAHAVSRNANFQPELLYLGTFLIDMAIVKALLS